MDFVLPTLVNHGLWVICGNDKIAHKSGHISKIFIHVHSVPSFEINGNVNALFSKKEPSDVGQKAGKQAFEENKLLLCMWFSCISYYIRNTVDNLHQETTVLEKGLFWFLGNLRIKFCYSKEGITARHTNLLLPHT